MAQVDMELVDDSIEIVNIMKKKCIPQESMK